jgi:N-acetylglucosaminyl-diphospho-decaprenol L-rhamnosyltransferase
MDQANRGSPTVERMTVGAFTGRKYGAPGVSVLSARRLCNTGERTLGLKEATPVRHTKAYRQLDSVGPEGGRIGAAPAASIRAYADRMHNSIDVVIVAHNRYALTESCLRHLSAQTVDHQVIVVDNGSTDDTRARIRAEWPAVQLERLDDNRGFSEACNRGAAAGSAEIVILLGNDVDCRTDFLERLITPLRDPAVGSIAPLLLQPGDQRIDCVGLTADPTLAGFPRLQGLPPARAGDVTPILAGPAAAAAAYRRVAWEQVGGLDEAIFLYMEDLDLALRLRTAGWRSVTEPNAVGVRLASATSRSEPHSQRHRQRAAHGRPCPAAATPKSVSHASA